MTDDRATESGTKAHFSDSATAAAGLAVWGEYLIVGEFLGRRPLQQRKHER